MTTCQLGGVGCRDNSDSVYMFTVHDKAASDTREAGRQRRTDAGEVLPRVNDASTVLRHTSTTALLMNEAALPGEEDTIVDGQTRLDTYHPNVHPDAVLCKIN